MKLFVAAESPEDDDDFSFTVPGELVHMPVAMCDCPDCGCERSMCGFASHKATSSFVVRDVAIEEATFTDLLFTSLRDAGWVTEDSAVDRTWVRDLAADHIRLASKLPVEAPLRFERDRIVVRPGI
jgi:hypothetical protein